MKIGNNSSSEIVEGSSEAYKMCLKASHSDYNSFTENSVKATIQLLYDKAWNKFDFEGEVL